MMGPRQQRHVKLFYAGLDLDARVDPAHPLRKIAAICDFTLVRLAVAPLYGKRGNPSLDPSLLLKLLFLLFYENVSSERELMRQLPCRLDWLWFLEMDLDSPIPDHSVLSKARRRWGPKVFAGFFQQILTSCIQAGLVDGSKVHIDGSLINASASMDKIQTALHRAGESFYDQLETAVREQPATGAGVVPAPPEVPTESAREAAPGEKAAGLEHTATGRQDAFTTAALPSTDSEILEEKPEEKPPIGSRYCPSDPEARLTRKYSLTVLGYKDHRVVDDRVGIITATLSTHAAVDEASMLMTLLDRHALSTGLIAYEPTADKGYGTAENYGRMQERGCKPCIPHKAVREDPALFARSRFIYDPGSDSYTCPAGRKLFRRGKPVDQRYRYQCATGVCGNCPLKGQCTASKKRVISRQLRQDAIDWADKCLSRSQRRSRMRRRKIRVEGSFADAANRHGYKRARWRGCREMTIQNLLIAATQNLRKLVRYGRLRPQTGAATSRRRSGNYPPPALTHNQRSLTIMIRPHAKKPSNQFPATSHRNHTR